MPSDQDDLHPGPPNITTRRTPATAIEVHPEEDDVQLTSEVGVESVEKLDPRGGYHDPERFAEPGGSLRTRCWYHHHKTS